MRAKVIGKKPLAALRADTERWLAHNPIPDAVTGGVTVAELAKIWNVSEPTTVRELNRMIAAGTAKVLGRRRCGRAYATVYELT